MDMQKVQVKSFEGVSADKLSDEVNTWMYNEANIQVAHTSICQNQCGRLVFFIFYWKKESEG